MGQLQIWVVEPWWTWAVEQRWAWAGEKRWAWAIVQRTVVQCRALAMEKRQSRAGRQGWAEDHLRLGGHGGAEKWTDHLTVTEQAECLWAASTAATWQAKYPRMASKQKVHERPPWPWQDRLWVQRWATPPWEELKWTPPPWEVLQWTQGLEQALERIHGLEQALERIHGLEQALERIHGLEQALERIHRLEQALEWIHGLEQALEWIHELEQAVERIHGQEKPLEHTVQDDVSRP